MNHLAVLSLFCLVGKCMRELRCKLVVLDLCCSPWTPFQKACPFSFRHTASALWACPLFITYRATGSGFRINNPPVVTQPFLSIWWQMLTVKPLVTGALVLWRLKVRPLFSCRANIIDGFLPQQFVQVMEQNQDLLKRVGFASGDIF